MQKIEGVYTLKNGVMSNEPKDVYLDKGVIADITDSAATPAEPLFATAGFIDEHTHGGYGHDYFEATQEAADAVAKFHLDNGTTSFVATAVATKLKDLDIQISKIRSLNKNYADMIGLHMEGPFISVKKKGAQPEENIKPVFEESDAEFFIKNKDILKIITLCPHVGNADKLVSLLTSLGITAHAGHDDSIEPEITKCVENGLTGATHLYCASSGLGRRKGDLTKYMGLNETALLKNEIDAEVIADGIHIPRSLFELILKNKGYRRIMLVSDSLSAAGMPVGNYKLGVDIDIYNNGDVALLADLSALAGSITPVSKMVRILVGYGIPLAEAVYMGNESPAKHLGLTDRGVLEIGKRADICLLSADAELKGVYLKGEKIK